MWTRFMDMHSGGGLKEEPYEYIYIEAPEDTAMIIFYNRFGHSPDEVTCECCGADYGIDEYKTIEEATDFRRGCLYGFKTLEEYVAQANILVIYTNSFKNEG